MKLLKASLVMVALICMVGLVGCSDDDPVAGDTGSTGSTGDTGDTGAVDLTGTWESNCFDTVWDPNDPTEGYGTAKYVAEYTATDAVRTITFYWNGLGPCSYALWEVVTTGTYTIGEDIVNGLGDTVTEIDYTVSSQEETILDPSGGTAAGFNSGDGTCLMTDWAYDETKDITGSTDCVPLPPSTGSVLKEVFQMQSATTFEASNVDAPPFGDARMDELADIIYTKIDTQADPSVRTMMHDGYERSYILTVPEKYKSSEPMPLVFSIHGYGGTAQGQFDYSTMHLLAEEFGFILVTPEGLSSSWNGGTCCGWAAENEIDDVGFLSAIIDAVMAEYSIDSNRIYSTGMSNGGYMSFRLACELSDRIAAIAPVSAGLRLSTCNPTRPVPVIAFNGTEDVLVPYASSAEDVENWAVANGCSDITEVVYQNGEVECIAYTDCDDGATVELCTVDGGGHTWPGSPIDLFVLDPVTYDWAGYQTQDIDASREAWEFFSEHPLPGAD